MTTKVEIEVESESCDCCPDCKMGNGGAMATAAEPSKDALLAELKTLLGKNDTNGQADRQVRIDELISQISDMGD